MKIKFFTKEKNFKKARSHGNPNLFWKLFIFMIFIVAIFSSFFGYQLFTQVNREFATPSDVSSAQAGMILKKERIDKVLEYFSLREQKSEQILNSPTPVIDPSL